MFKEKLRNSIIFYNEDYAEYQLKRSKLRKYIRTFYLKQVYKYVEGKAIDFGCGIGELLANLPTGSIGLEVNETAVRYCKKKGLRVNKYDPEIDKYQFKNYDLENYATFIICHVLEHIENVSSIFRTICRSCNRLGIRKIIVVVPGLKGFKFDKTHRTFINEDYLKKNNMLHLEGYYLAKKIYFPLNFEILGNYFRYHELIVIYEKII